MIEKYGLEAWVEKHPMLVASSIGMFLMAMCASITLLEMVK